MYDGLGASCQDGAAIDHLGINCADWEKSKTFYDTVLGVLGYTRQLDYQVAEYSTRAVVEFRGDDVERVLGERGQLGVLVQVLAQQPVRVLVGAALPSRYHLLTPAYWTQHDAHRSAAALD